MRERSDEQLMKSYADGNMEAFEILYERHRGPLYRYILRLAANPATANDLYQGSWEKIIKARSRYKSSAPFRAWMYRIAHNHVMDHFRRLHPAGNTTPDEVADNQAEPDEQLATDQRQQDLLAAIHSLPPEQKDTLILKIEAGLDLQTIAEVTGVNRETAKSRLRYAVNRLKLILGNQGPRTEI
jgi:RNA polymerase sigma-70 factor (ECF subfamily)